MKHFALMAALDVGPAVKAMRANRHFFREMTFRQETAGSPHHDTETIFLRMPPVISKESIFEGMDAVDYPAMSIPEFAAPVGTIASFMGGIPARAMIVSLKAGGRVQRHFDEGKYADSTERFHLCLTTNDNCSMHIGDERVNMSPGELWWFNKHEWHSVENNGASERAHLIVDVWV